jgi:hypothetical protein
MLLSLGSLGQTNISIFNSKVIINNYTIYSEPTTNILQYQTNKMVVLPQYTIERLRWERMLQQRRNVAFRTYLKNLSR